MNKSEKNENAFVEIEYSDVMPNEFCTELANKVIGKCFEVENLKDKNIYVSIIFTTPKEIQKYNKEYRNINRPTDILSFPIFEKEEIEEIQENPCDVQEVLGDLIVNLSQIKIQADEYGHSFERELAYMLVHGFYHLMGYDHIIASDKKIMREKEENILNILNITRE